MNKRDESCAERIEAHMTGRADHLAELYERADGPGTTADFDHDESDEEAARDEPYELPLSVETVRTVKVLLSAGGPADGFTFEIADDVGGVENVRYWFADWFDHAETRVPNDSPIWRYAEEIAETFIGSDR